MLPDLLVSLAPVTVGIILLIRDFSWTILAAVILVLVLATAGNAAVRSNLACRRCRQRQLGCPAEALFQKSDAG